MKRKISDGILIIAFIIICFIINYVLVDKKIKKENENNPTIDISYETVIGCYQGYPIDIENNDKGIAYLSLYSDGTYSYSWAPGLHTIGNYIIIDDEIYMNDLFSVGSDPTMKIIDSKRILMIKEDTLYDNELIINEDGNDYEGVKLIKESRCSSENGFDLAMKNLQNYYMERNK